MLHEKNMAESSANGIWLSNFHEPIDFSGLWMRPRKEPHFYVAEKFDKGSVWIRNKDIVGSYAE